MDNNFIIQKLDHTMMHGIDGECVSLICISWFPKSYHIVYKKSGKDYSPLKYFLLNFDYSIFSQYNHQIFLLQLTV